jgi:hypothetical protein
VRVLAGVVSNYAVPLQLGSYLCPVFISSALESVFLDES